MDLKLAGKRALVTGSTAGIGIAIAAGLLREGAHVIVNGRTHERVSRAMDELGTSLADGAALEGFAGDLSESTTTTRLAAEYPDVDILVNNLGVFEAKPFADIQDDDWERIWQTNVMSGVRLSRYYLPKMLKKNAGRILFISSESGVQIPQEMVHYGVTKTAQIALARGMAELTAGTGVTVNSVLAGPTRSEGVDKFIQQLAAQSGGDEAAFEREFFEKVRPSSLLKRFASTKEVANMVVYLASELASATNGAAVRVEGGVIRAIV